MRLRLSIARLMVLVAIAAASSALAAFAVRLRAGPVLALTAALLAALTVAGPTRRGWARVVSLGLALPGWAYYAVICMPQARVSLPTSRLFVRLYEAAFGTPTVTGPEDIHALIRWLHDYLAVAHALTALALGLAGWLIALSIASIRARRAPTPA